MFVGAAPRHYRSGTSSPSGTGAITQLPAVGGGGDRGLVSGLQRGCVPSLLQVISKSRIGASHFRKHIPHKPLPGQASPSLSLCFLLYPFRRMFFLPSFSLFLFLCPAGPSQRDSFHTSLRGASINTRSKCQREPVNKTGG